MKTIEYLKLFAQEQGIDVNEVSRFLNKYKNPQTLDDLLAMPSDMLNHLRHTTDLDEAIKEYIFAFNPRRYETIELDRLVDDLRDNMNYHKYRFEEGKMPQVEFDEKMKLLRAVEQKMIETKFGSVVINW